MGDVLRKLKKEGKIIVQVPTWLSLEFRNRNAAVYQWQLENGDMPLDFISPFPHYSNCSIPSLSRLSLSLSLTP